MILQLEHVSMLNWEELKHWKFSELPKIIQLSWKKSVKTFSEIRAWFHRDQACEDLFSFFVFKPGIFWIIGTFGTFGTFGTYGTYGTFGTFHTSSIATLLLRRGKTQVLFGITEPLWHLFYILPLPSNASGLITEDKLRNVCAYAECLRQELGQFLLHFPNGKSVL